MRVIELLDTYREILSSALDLHLSNVSNRLNRVMKQLTVVATIFMPLSFIVGFFWNQLTTYPSTVSRGFWSCSHYWPSRSSDVGVHAPKDMKSVEMICGDDLRSGSDG